MCVVSRPKSQKNATATGYSHSCLSEKATTPRTQPTFSFIPFISQSFETLIKLRSRLIKSPSPPLNQLSSFCLTAFSSDSTNAFFSTRQTHTTYKMDFSPAMWKSIPGLISDHYKQGNLNWPMIIYISLVHGLALAGLWHTQYASRETLMFAFILWPIRCVRFFMFVSCFSEV
jgi:cytochrome c oxidase subunit IV